MGKLSSLLQLMIYVHYWLLFFKNDNFKHTTTTQRRTFNSFSLFYFFFISSFSNSHRQRNITSIIYIAYRILFAISSFCYVRHYIESEICIVGRFLEDCFYCYSQQIISTAANVSLIPYNLMKVIWDSVTPNPNTNQTLKTLNTTQFLEQNIFFHTNINNKNTCKIACKMQCLKNGL